MRNSDNCSHLFVVLISALLLFTGLLVIGGTASSAMGSDMLTTGGPGTTANITGHVRYSGGPLDGEDARDGSIILHNSADNMTFGPISTNPSGVFSFSNIPHHAEYDLMITPQNPVTNGGNNSGYTVMILSVNLSSDMELNITLDHYELTPPSSGPIYGVVQYKTGDKAGSGAAGALIELKDPEDGNTIASTTTDESGFYILGEIEFGFDLTIKASPPAEETGKWGVVSGYLPSVSSPFQHKDGVNTSVSFQLNYYVLDPVEQHPNILITDEDGHPIAGVVVEVTLEDDQFTAVTDVKGYAEFVQLVGEEFPSGSRFTASLSGYENASWDQGDVVPDLVKVDTDDDDENDSMVILIVFVITMIAVLILIMATGKLGGNKEGK